MMKKYLLTFMLAVASCLTANATDFYLWFTDIYGDEMSWQVNELRKITFSDGCITITRKDGKSDTWAINNVVKLNFHTEPTAIANVKSQTEVAFDGQTLSVNAQQGTTVAIYTTTGTLAGRAEVGTDGQIALDALPKGVYMVKIGNKTHKVLKK